MRQEFEGEKEFKKLKKILFDFVERAAKENATPAEVEALPDVAKVLYGMLQD